MKTTRQLNRNFQFAFRTATLIVIAVGAICYRGLIASCESDESEQ
jgi:hypothetical protein